MIFASCPISDWMTRLPPNADPLSVRKERIECLDRSLQTWTAWVFTSQI